MSDEGGALEPPTQKKERGVPFLRILLALVTSPCVGHFLEFFFVVLWLLQSSRSLLIQEIFKYLIQDPTQHSSLKVEWKDPPNQASLP